MGTVSISAPHTPMWWWLSPQLQGGGLGRGDSASDQGVRGARLGGDGRTADRGKDTGHWPEVSWDCKA